LLLQYRKLMKVALPAILLIFYLQADGQSVQSKSSFPSFSYANISTKQGLSNRAVTDIAQDANGMIWVATVDGVNRLEGYRVKQFFNAVKDKNALFNSDRGSLNTEFVDRVCIAAQTGVTVFNLKSGRFELIDSLNKTNLHRQKRIRFYKQKNKLWVFGHEYYYRISPNLFVEEFGYNKAQAQIDTQQHAFSNFITQVKEDSYGNLWAINPVFLMKINAGNMRVTAYYKIKDENGAGDIQDLDIQKDIIYLSTWGKGLISFNTKTKRFTSIASCGSVCKDASFLGGSDSATILIVAGSPKNYLLNINTLQSQAIANVPEGREVLVDKHNTVWFGTDDGLFVSQASNKYIKTINLKALNAATQKTDELTSTVVFKDNSTNYASCINGAGLLQFDEQWNFKNFSNSFGKSYKQKGFENVRTIYTVDDITWVGSQAGLSRCDKNLNIIKHYVPQYDQVSSANPSVVNKIIPLPNKQILLKGFSTIHIFDIKTESFVKSYYNSSDGKHQFVNDFIGKCIVDGDIVYLAADEGLKKLNLSTNQLEDIPFSKAKQPVLDFLEIGDTIWLCTLNGLVAYKLSDKSSTVYTRDNGLPADNIRHILQGKSGILWLATTNGLSAFEIAKKTFTNFSDKDGLVDNILEYAFALDNDTNLVIGHRNFLSIVNTGIIKQQNASQKTLITELLVNGKPMYWTIANNAKSITLQHNQNLIGLFFCILNDRMYEASNYYYKFNDTWLQSNTGQVQLNNLAPGTYTIYVANTPKDDIENDYIIVTIKPPFYNAWWFYLLCALALGSIVYAFFKYRANTIRKQLGLQKDYELKLQNLEMQSLRSQMNPHFIFNTLNSINSFIIQNHTDLASEYLTKFSKLMRSILDHSKQETINLSKELQTLSMYLELESVRLEHKFDYGIIVDKDIVADSVQVPSLIIQPFVENALWHGLHNKKGNGHIQINIAQTADNTMSISITDDGIGRKAAAALKRDQVQHKSYGIDITTARLQLLHPQNSINTTDLYDNDHNAIGTKVEIILKLK
jgi:two-component sensor histidine kinase